MFPLAKIQEGREALIAIRDQRLYREYVDEEGRRLTFEGYCQRRFGITRYYAHRLIEFQRVRENMLPRGNIPPVTEGQARPLTKLEPEDQAEAWARTQKETGKEQPSGAEVAKVVAELEKERRSLPFCVPGNRQRHQRVMASWAASEKRLAYSEIASDTGYSEITSAISALRLVGWFGGRYRVLGIWWL